MTKVLVVTHWDEVRKLEEEIIDGNPKILVQFLEFLIKNEFSFRGQLLVDICEYVVELRSEGHWSKKDIEAAWSLLHDFSHDYYKSKPMLKGGKDDI
jgi:hypothetical protein